ncbi:MAG: patatin-like phospholipase family protein [Candidatus Gastranaerophilales bacterium]|nr:patatin-like phospholipase family protein [Candidatus Gastranaerophilales bacterium]
MNKDLNYLCIFGGGAVRGYAYIGVQRAFEELGIVPKMYAGSSVGAILSAFLAAGATGQDLYDIFSEVNYELFRDINLSFSPTFSISKGGVLLDWLRNNLEKIFYKENYIKDENSPICFKDLEKDLLIITTDIKNSKPFIFSKFHTPDFEVAEAIRISGSMPGLLTPVEHEEKLLTDGDLLKSNPLWKLDKSLCPENLRILEFRLEGGKYNKISSVFGFFNTLYNTITNCSTDFVMGLYAKQDKFDYIKIDTEDILLVNFNLSTPEKQKLIDIGYTTTMEFFNKTLPAKRTLIYEDYKALITLTGQLKDFLSGNKLTQTKNTLGEIFMLLNSQDLKIDIEIYQQLTDFKNLFLKSRAKGFFGNDILKDKDKLRQKLLILKKELDTKHKEFEKYFHLQ